MARNPSDASGSIVFRMSRLSCSSSRSAGTISASSRSEMRYVRPCLLPPGSLLRVLRRLREREAGIPGGGGGRRELYSRLYGLIEPNDGRYGRMGLDMFLSVVQNYILGTYLRFYRFAICIRSLMSRRRSFSSIKKICSGREFSTRPSANSSLYVLPPWHLGSP